MRKKKLIATKKKMGGNPKVAILGAVDELANEYYQLRKQKNTIESRMSELSKRLKEYAQSSGVKDIRGSYYLNREEYRIGDTLRRTTKVNDEKAVALLKKKKLKGYIEIRESVSKETIEQLLENSLLSEKEVVSILDVTESRSIDLRKQDEIQDVEEYSFKADSFNSLFGS